MRTVLANVLNDCIERMGSGETFEACLERYHHLSKELEPLLAPAQSIFILPKVTPSDEFINASRDRLVTRIRQETVPKNAKQTSQMSYLVGPLQLWQRAFSVFTSLKKLAIPVTLGLILVLVVGLFGIFPFSPPSPALASQCTLSILSGEVEVISPDATGRQQGNDGMTLTVGTRIRTGADSRAVLTFLEGSTITLEPGTEVDIEQIQIAENQTRSIILKQWLGRTWSRVVKLADPGSRYQINTPTATAIVRGTLFITEVEESGLTKIATTQGLVSVIAQGDEVLVPANYQTQVEPDAKPSSPARMPDPSAEFIVSVDEPAVGSVMSPAGASTGILPDGSSFNQIPNSRSFFPSEGTQRITIAKPTSGEYLLTLRYLADGKARFIIQTRTKDGAGVTYSGEWSATKGNGWLLHLNLQVDNGLINGIALSKVEPLGGGTLKNLITSASVDDKTVSEKAGLPDGNIGDGSDPQKVSTDETTPGETTSERDSDKAKDSTSDTTPRETSGDSGSDKGKDSTSDGAPGGSHGRGSDKDDTNNAKEPDRGPRYSAGDRNGN